LGDLLEIGSRSAYFAASLFYNRISRVPNGFAASAFFHQLKCRAYVRLNIRKETREREWLLPPPSAAPLRGYPTDFSVRDIVTERRLI